jgi:hypothetical protein
MNGPSWYAWLQGYPVFAGYWIDLDVIDIYELLLLILKEVLCTVI